MSELFVDVLSFEFQYKPKIKLRGSLLLITAIKEEGKQAYIVWVEILTEIMVLF